VLKKLCLFLKSWRGFWRFDRAFDKERRVTFYSEGADYAGFLRPIVNELIENHAQPVSFVTSDPEDPFLKLEHPCLRSYFVGYGSARIFFFLTLRTNVLALTMTDLEKLHIRRSRYPVQYAYIFHSMVSTHMIYTKGAFDNYDSILCVGPHQIKEIRAWEELNALGPKKLFDHGYGPLDYLLEAGETENREEFGDLVTVLIAPSWSAEGLLETGAETLVEILLTAGFRVVIRPHPRTKELTPHVVAALADKFREHPYCSMDFDTSGFGSFHAADVMISDWSGAALEFALGLGKPVLFLDVPRKINNPDYELLHHEPVEVTLRTQLGDVLDLQHLDEAPTRIRTLCAQPERRKNNHAICEKYIFNIGRSAMRGAEILLELADQDELAQTLDPDTNNALD